MFFDDFEYRYHINADKRDINSEIKKKIFTC